MLADDDEGDVGQFGDRHLVDGREVGARTDHLVAERRDGRRHLL